MTDPESRYNQALRLFNEDPYFATLARQMVTGHQDNPRMKTLLTHCRGEPQRAVASLLDPSETMTTLYGDWCQEAWLLLGGLLT